MLWLLTVIVFAVALGVEARCCKKKGNSACRECEPPSILNASLDCPYTGWDCSDTATNFDFKIVKSRETGCYRLKCNNTRAHLFLERREYKRLRCREYEWHYGSRTCEHTFHAICAMPCTHCKAYVPHQFAGQYYAASLRPLTVIDPCRTAYCANATSQLVGLQWNGTPTPLGLNANLTCNGYMQWVAADKSTYAYAVCQPGTTKIADPLNADPLAKIIFKPTSDPSSTTTKAPTTSWIPSTTPKTSTVTSTTPSQTSTARVTTTSQITTSSKPPTTSSQIRTSTAQSSTSEKPTTTTTPQRTTSTEPSTTTTTTKTTTASEPSTTSTVITTTSEPTTASKKLSTSSEPTTTTSQTTTSSEPSTTTTIKTTTSSPSSTTAETTTTSKPSTSTTSRVSTSSIPSTTSSPQTTSTERSTTTSKSSTSSEPSTTTVQSTTSSNPSSTTTSKITSSSAPSTTTSASTTEAPTTTTAGPKCLCDPTNIFKGYPDVGKDRHTKPVVPGDVCNGIPAPMCPDRLTYTGQAGNAFIDGDSVKTSRFSCVGSSWRLDYLEGGSATKPRAAIVTNIACITSAK